MAMTRIGLTASLLAASAIYALASPSAEAASVPDFSGVWTRTWKTPGTFDPPPSGQGPITVDPAHPHNSRTADNGTINYAISGDAWVPDLTNPILKPETREKLKKIAEQEIAGNPHLELSTMCSPPGVPEVLNLRDDMQMLQSPKEVVILYSRDHWVRHIYLNQPHSKDPGHSWFGESVGKYEGDTLVVDTIGENDKTHSDRFGTPHSNQIHVIERYSLTPDRKRLNVLVTVDDPGAFTMPWSARADYRPDDWFFEEHACAENNRPTGPGFDIPMPVADKFDF
jgi:hypothetical protein